MAHELWISMHVSPQSPMGVQLGWSRWKPCNPCRTSSTLAFWPVDCQTSRREGCWIFYRFLVQSVSGNSKGRGIQLLECCLRYPHCLHAVLQSRVTHAHMKPGRKSRRESVEGSSSVSRRSSQYVILGFHYKKWGERACSLFLGIILPGSTLYSWF